jgi:hypothetical protein
MYRSLIRRARWAAMLAAAAVAVAVAAVAGDALPARAVRAQPASGAFVGRLESIDAVIGIVVTDGGAVTAFVTDGRGIADWFRGVPGTGAALAARSGGQLQFPGGGAAAGRYIAADGRAAEFVADPALGQAGIYRAETLTSGEKVVSAGWVVMNDGQVRGALTVRADVDESDVTSGLDPSTLDLTTMFANLPAIGVVRVIRVGQGESR